VTTATARRSAHTMRATAAGPRQLAGRSGTVACVVYRAGRLPLPGPIRVSGSAAGIAPGNPDPPPPMLRIKERLLRVWTAYKRWTELSFPRRFPIAQFPNLPLIVAILAGEAGKFLDGSAHSYAASVAYLAMTIWAYEELARGVNWFRHLLGLAYMILLVVHVADALHA
jgi:hypothetical protein